MTGAARRTLSLCGFVLWLGGCAPPSGEVKVPAREIPSAFGSESSGPSAAGISWRSYFGDPALNELIHGTLAGSPDLFIALQRIEIARAGVQSRSGARLPHVSLAAGAGISRAGKYTAEGAGNATTEITPGQRVPTDLTDFGIGLQTSWELDVWGKLKNQERSALAQYLATIEGTRLVITNLVADVANAYFELVALDRTLDVLTQTIERQREALAVVRLQKEAGRANELAVQQFEAQLESTTALATATEQRIRSSENQLNLLRGTYPGPVVRTMEGLLRPVASALATGVPSELLRNRPDVREAEQQLVAARCDVAAARAAFFPSFTISGGIGYQAFNPKYLFETPASLVYSATAGVVAPLVNRSAIEAEFNAAKAFQVQAMYQYQKAVLTAYVEVANGVNQLETSAKLVLTKQRQRSAVEQTVSTADILYRAGKASYFEVLMAQQNTLSTELELIEAMRDQQAASVAVYRALGGGWRE